MEVNTAQVADATVLEIVGRLDGNTAEVLESKFINLLDSGNKRFVFNLEHLEYISSAGLRIVLVAAKKLKAIQGTMTLAGLNENVQEVFDMSGFSTILAIYKTVDEAIEALGR